MSTNHPRHGTSSQSDPAGRSPAACATTPWPTAASASCRPGSSPPPTTTSPRASPQSWADDCKPTTSVTSRSPPIACSPNMPRSTSCSTGRRRSACGCSAATARPCCVAATAAPNKPPPVSDPCQCPLTLKGRWQAAKAGHGCEPLVHLTLRLAADPALGRFLLSSATWTFADRATTAKAALRRRQGPVRARLLIDRALHTTASGTIFAYTRPTITVFPAA
jgi:hypothetical protein